jgi:hypothetical protein
MHQVAWTARSELFEELRDVLTDALKSDETKLPGELKQQMERVLVVIRDFLKAQRCPPNARSPAPSCRLRKGEGQPSRRRGPARSDNVGLPMQTAAPAEQEFGTLRWLGTFVRVAQQLKTNAHRLRLCSVGTPGITPVTRRAGAEYLPAWSSTTIPRWCSTTTKEQTVDCQAST